MADPAYLKGVLREGAGSAAGVADVTLRRAKRAMGFLDLNDF